MNYIPYIIAYGIIATYMVFALGVFFVLRRKTRLGYALLAATLLWGIIPAFISGSIYGVVDAVVGTVFFISLVAWFASKYELVKRVKNKP